MANQNPYDFILNPAAPPKKSILPAGNSKKQRIFLIAGGGVILLMLMVVVAGLLSSAGSAQKQDWQDLMEQQTELIRVSDIGVQKAKGSEAKNLATTTKLSLETSKFALQGFASKAGADVSEKRLAAGRDAQTDSTLEQAEQSNEFDKAFISTIRKQLLTYQQLLKKLYDGTTSDKTKTELQAAHQNVTLLIPQEKDSGS